MEDYFEKAQKLRYSSTKERFCIVGFLHALAEKNYFLSINVLIFAQKNKKKKPVTIFKIYNFSGL